MKNFIIIIFVFYVGFIKAQIKEQWSLSFGGLGDDNIVAIGYDENENIYLIGNYESTIVNDTYNNEINITSKGAKDIYIIKYSKNGQIIWAKSLGGVLEERAKDIKIKNNYFIVTGFFTGIADFDPSDSIYNLISKGKQDIFIAKYTLDGNLIWAKSIGGSGPDIGRAIWIDDNDNVILSGDFNSTVDFDPDSGVYTMNTIDIPGITDIFIAKYNADGGFIWSKQLIGKNYNYAKSLYVDEQNNIYLTGTFFKIVDFNPDIDTFNLSALGTGCDIYIVKFDDSGRFIWAKSIGGMKNDFSTSVFVKNTSLYIVGHFQETVDFDPGDENYYITANGLHDIFLLKLDTAGNFVWVKTIGGSGSDLASALSVDEDENIFLVGSFSNTVEFNPSFNTNTLTSFGSYDSYFCQFSSNGELLYLEHLGSTGSDGLSSVITFNHNIYIVGNYANTLQFDFLPYSFTSVGLNDCYLVKYYNCKPQIYIQNVTISLYDSIYFNNQYLNESGIYFDTLFSSYQCDSIIQLNLTTLDVPLPVDLLSFKINCLQKGALISWITASETNNDYFTVEKSTNFLDWKLVAYLKPFLSHNNTMQHYSIIDSTFISGQTTYYKLKQTDLDGKTHNLAIQAIFCKAPDNELDIFGININKSDLNILLKSNSLEPIELVIQDVYGKIIVKDVIVIQETGMVCFTNLNLMSGLYVLSAYQNGEKKIKKIILH